jgi:hypothetical protein
MLLDKVAAYLPRGCGAPMSLLLSVVDQLDRLCGQLATAIDGAQPRLYAMVGLAVVAAFLVVPRKDDPDQI